MTALELRGVTAAYGRGARARHVLDRVDLGVEPGESVAVVGRSGSGKSTLADVVLGLRRPTGGIVHVDGRPWISASAAARRADRHLVQGIPQDPAAAFVPGWTLRRSIGLAAARLLGDHDATERIERAARLARLDAALLDRTPREVSGGQAQRAAIARAVAMGPAVLVADEPTSALDGPTAAAVADALFQVAEVTGTALLLVTHDPALAARCAHTVTITAPEGRR
ncbi:ATP-binding cassette domain-containing protein [Tessaracoccus palaemonis]|uniref:ATP-binding cassette domain-containing protein n=1 Tax=Tessaracoccus palaemonis TaxID=2829499 RepID=A0ABX8SH13_9ACTN|nr:ATP-binding cassette domain-containing protein [Tessaracoccus palaemonis]QXT61975.1 ATP-binding cassette domain-containing protein [Tessaracoccus palaemonis]